MAATAPQRRPVATQALDDPALSPASRVAGRTGVAASAFAQAQADLANAQASAIRAAFCPGHLPVPTGGTTNAARGTSITAKYLGLGGPDAPLGVRMRELRPFSPIEPGEIDNVGFDFTPDVGAATIVASDPRTTFTCQLAPYQTISDPAPQAHILSTQIAGTIEVRSAIDETLSAKLGFFALASIGGFQNSSIGGIYILEATVALSDGRVLKRNNTITCKAPGT